MDGAPDGPTADFMRGVIRWLTHGSVWQETESGFVVGLQRRTYSRIMEGPTDSNSLSRISRSAENLKPTWQPTKVIVCTDPISVALDWVSGRDSPATNPLQRSNPPSGVYYLAERNSITEMIQARK